MKENTALIRVRKRVVAEQCTPESERKLILGSKGCGVDQTIHGGGDWKGAFHQEHADFPEANLKDSRSTPSKKRTCRFAVWEETAPGPTPSEVCSLLERIQTADPNLGSFLSPLKDLECCEELDYPVLLFNKEINENIKIISPCNTKIESDFDESDLLLDCVELLRKKKWEYTPNADKVLEKHIEITPLMRAVLLDWMMEVCFELKLRRDVFHYAVNYVDRYLVAIPSIPMNRLQLVGMVALMIACKIEEVAVPKISEFISTALGQYSLSEVQQEEQAMLGALKWRLVPPTLYAWAALSLPQWDQFISRSESSFVISNLPNLLFKSPTKESYELFREMLQLLDATLLVLETLQYDQRALVVSALYLILALHLDPASLVFPPSETLLFAPTPLNSIFSDFLSQTFSLELIELLPSLQHLAPFLSLQFECDLPPFAILGKEDSLSIQTFNTTQIEVVKRLYFSQ